MATRTHERKAIQVGLIGTGKRAMGRIVPAIEEIRGKEDLPFKFVPTAFASLGGESAGRAAEGAGRTLGNNPAVLSGEEGAAQLIGRADVDLVVITSPNDLHFDQAVMALRAGKHVYCDKPLSANAEQMEELKRLAKANQGLITQAGYPFRFDPIVQGLNEMIEKGKINLGELVGATHNYSMDMELSGWQGTQIGFVHAIAAAGCHSLDMQVQLMGMLGSYPEMDTMFAVASEIGAHGLPMRVNAAIPFSGMNRTVNCFLNVDLKDPNGFGMGFGIEGTEGELVWKLNVENTTVTVNRPGKRKPEIIALQKILEHAGPDTRSSESPTARELTELGTTIQMQAESPASFEKLATSEILGHMIMRRAKLLETKTK